MANIGSNQYQEKHGLRPATKRTIFYLLGIILCIALVGFNAQLKIKQLEAQAQIISPVAISPVLVQAEYKAPPMASLDGQSKAIEIIRRTWRKDWKVGVAIAKCESGLRAEATNDNKNSTRDFGYFQVNSVHKIDASDPVANAAFAKILYDEQGLNPWNSSKKCWGSKI